MRRSSWGRRGGTLALVATVLALGGCTGSDEIVHSLGNLTVRVEATGSSGRYDSVTWSVVQFTVQPTNPDVQSSLKLGPGEGNTGIRLGAFPVAVEIAGQPQTVVASTLSVGTYQITSLLLSGLYLKDDDGPLDPSSVNCVDRKSAVPMPDTLRWPPNDTVEFPESSNLTITPGGTHEVVIRVDLDEVVSRAEANFLCGTLDRRCLTDVEPPPDAFCVDATAFRPDLVPNIVTVQQVR